MKRRRLWLDISCQPDERTCGPTSLQAVYRFFGDDVALEEVIREVSVLREGGTVAVSLACHALARGYRARLFSYNLRVFDPTWFDLTRGSLLARLREQARRKTDPKMLAVSDAYVEFLEQGDPRRPRERTFADELRQALRATRPDLRVRRNYPYLGRADGLVTTLRRRFAEDEYLGLEVEVNQAWPLGDPLSWQRLAADLVAVFAAWFAGQRGAAAAAGRRPRSTLRRGAASPPADAGP